MALATVTNAQVDTAAAAVAAPFGPLTRVTDVEALPSPNTNIIIELTSPLNTTSVYLTYEQLVDTDTLTHRLITALSVRDVNAQTEAVYRVVRALADNMDSWAAPPYTDVEWQLTIDVLRTIRAIVGGQLNVDVSYEGVSDLQAGFTISVVGDPDAAVVDTSTGDILLYSWDWGDGTFSAGEVPGDHTYLANGVYTVTQTVVGRAGYSTFTRTATIAGA